MDAMNLMTSGYNLQRSELEASKAEILSEIEGAKNRIDVGISEGDLTQVKTTINSHKVTQGAELDRLNQRKDKYVRDMDRSKSYLSMMVIKAPNDGIVNILPNFRAPGSFGSSPPPFKEGDRAWTGAPIAEIPDLSEMRIDLKLEEVDRGKIKLGQKIRIRVDAPADNATRVCCGPRDSKRRELKIAELFYSIQGEGSLVGVPSVFIRTSGCNLRCAWCDTPYASWKPEGEDRSVGSLLEQVAGFGARYVVLTGGEPMLAPQIGELTAGLHGLGMHITIETAGTVAPGLYSSTMMASCPAESRMRAMFGLSKK